MRPRCQGAVRRSEPGRAVRKGRAALLTANRTTRTDGTVNAKPQHKGSEEARSHLPALLSDAEPSRSTVISHRGRAGAVLVPIGHAAVSRLRPLLPLAGSGRGLWAAGGPAAIATQRDEWSR